MGNYRCMGCMMEYDDSLGACPYCNHPKNVVATDPNYLPEGFVLDGRYTVGISLGKGPFSVTYLGWDFAGEKKVVIKEYFPQDFASRGLGQGELNTFDGEKSKQYENGLMAFVDEANNMMKLSSSLDSIAKVNDVFVANSTAYCVMEYIDGVTIDRVISSGTLTWSEASQIMQPLLQSMIILQDNNLINSNISPDNIMMTRDRKVMLVGSGSSRLATTGANMNLSLITKNGYSPVEMYSDKVDLKPNIDVYSLAAVIYYTITGIVPPSAMDRANKDTLKSPKELGVSIPDSANTAIMNALNVNEKYRTIDCRKFYDELFVNQRVVRVHDVKIKQDNGKMSKKTKALIAIVAAITVAIIGAIIGVTVGLNNNVKNDNDSATVGNFVKMEIEEAKEIAKEKGLELYVDGTMELEGVKEGTEEVAWQDVDPNTRIADVKNRSINIKVAKPPVERGIMPNLTGETKADAIKKLNEAGFKYIFKVKYSEDVNKGLVCDQSIEANEKMDAGTVVTIYVSKGVASKTTVATTTKRYSNNQNNNNNYYHANNSGNNKKKPQNTTKAQQNTTKTQQNATRATTNAKPKPDPKPDPKPEPKPDPKPEPVKPDSGEDVHQDL